MVCSSDLDSELHFLRMPFLIEHFPGGTFTQLRQRQHYVFVLLLLSSHGLFYIACEFLYD